MANDFSGDANCKALWRLENGALTTDSIGTNTLSNTSVVADTVNYKEGSASGNFTNAYLSITDANLDAGFPLKSGDSTKVISVCQWVNLDSSPSSGSAYTLYSKYGYNVGKRSFLIWIYNNGSNNIVQLRLGYNNGASAEIKAHASALSTGTWYNITCTYDNSDKSWAILVRDTNGNTVGSDATGTATLDVNKLFVGDSTLSIGVIDDGTGTSFYHDGKIDEIVVFNDIISAAEATQIAQGSYAAGGAAGLVLPILSSAGIHSAIFGGQILR